MARTASGWKLRQHQSGYWYVRFTHRCIRYDQSTGKVDRGDATEEAGKIYSAIVNGFVPAPRKSSSASIASDLNLLIGMWISDLEKRKSGEWAKTCTYYAVQLWPWKDLTSIDSASISDYISARLDHVVAGTVRKELSALRQFLRWCKLKKYLSVLPEWDAPSGKSDFVPEWLTAEEMGRVLTKLPTWRMHIRHAPIREYYIVLWTMSWRRATIARLAWTDVDLEAQMVTIRASTDKARNARRVPLPNSVVEVLRDLPRRAGGLIFGTRDYRRALRQACIDIGIDPVRAQRIRGNHSIRHSRISYWLSQSQDLAAVQYMAGHTTLVSTTKYVHSHIERASALLALDEPAQDGGDRSGVCTPERAKNGGMEPSVAQLSGLNDKDL